MTGDASYVCWWELRRNVPVTRFLALKGTEVSHRFGRSLKSWRLVSW